MQLILIAILKTGFLWHVAGERDQIQRRLQNLERLILRSDKPCKDRVCSHSPFPSTELSLAAPRTACPLLQLPH